MNVDVLAEVGHNVTLWEWALCFIDLADIDGWSLKVKQAILVPHYS